MSTFNLPGNKQYKGLHLPHWMMILFMTVGFLLFHVLLPWGLSFLTTRYGWNGGRPGPWNLLALVLLVIPGIAGAVWMMVLQSRATPSSFLEFRATDKVIMHSLYAVSRNPMFAFELLFWLGWSLFYGSIPVFIVFLAWFTFFNFLAIPWEERDLEKRFGEDYRIYKAHVPRWFGIPHQ